MATPLGKLGYSSLITGPAAANFAGLDQGLDFTGAGDIHALGSGKVTRVGSHTGWPGEGNMVVYQLTDGPQKGRYVYSAEDLKPLVKLGDLLHPGQIIAHATGSGQAPGVELGFASNAAGSAYGNIHEGKGGNAPDPQATALQRWVTGGSIPAAPAGSSSSDGGGGGGILGSGVGPNVGPNLNPVDAFKGVLSGLWDSIKGQAAYAGLAAVVILGGFVLLGTGVLHATHSRPAGAT